MGEQKINFNDINYAIYKLGNWKLNYKINQIGLSNEIPFTKNTKEHIILSMNEIRKAEFEINNVKVNGFVVIAYQTNNEFKQTDLKDIIKLEEEEYENILKELDSLELVDNGSVELETEKYLIYKLEKECHITKAIPANQYTMKHHIEEIKKIEKSLN